MPTMRDIKGRIRSVTTTKKTTKAMNLVSSSKLARAKAKLTRGTPFFDQMRRVIVNIVDSAGEVEHKYFEKRKVKRSLIIVIANDRGLCGGYNANVCKYAVGLAKSLPNEAVFFTIGKKARDFVRNLSQINGNDGGIIDHMGGISESPFYDDALEIADKIMPLYESGLIDEVHVCYTQFVTAITYVPTHIRILPLDAADFAEEREVQSGMKSLMSFEPSPKEVLDYVVPKYLATIIFSALSTSAAAGQAATMMAMDSATENAENIIDGLTLMYNRARQAAITQEVSEIVGGANALK